MFSLYIRPLTLIDEHIQQSPLFAVPCAMICGSDSATRIAAVCREWRLPELIADVASQSFATAPARAEVPTTLAYAGDYPSCYAFTGLRAPNRPLPTTVGRTSFWSSPLCWLCGAGGAELYSAERWKVSPRIRADFPPNSPICGLPLGRIFYAPVHAACQAGLALLADLCWAYNILPRPAGLSAHPVTAHIWGLFPNSTWDPLL